MGEVPRAGNDSGGGQLGNAIHCKPHGANDWLYIVVQCKSESPTLLDPIADPAAWDEARAAHGRPARKEDIAAADFPLVRHFGVLEHTWLHGEVKTKGSDH